MPRCHCNRGAREISFDYPVHVYQRAKNKSTLVTITTIQHQYSRGKRLVIIAVQKMWPRGINKNSPLDQFDIKKIIFSNFEIKSSEVG